jgi:selenocysteine-specific elongation factor
MHIVATAGHVDHGKSTLILTLTGTDPDRWQEEKQRGLTIDLGFGHTTLPSGSEISFVDVPGHVRFLKNMLAGVGAVDACMFVVAATEGWKPQSEEHLRILDLLGIKHGIIALTKVGLVDRDWRELAIMDIEEHVAGTFLEGAPIVPVDAPKGVGIHELRDALDNLLRVTPPAVDRNRPRLWIDRVFAAKGSGTVVTGTLTGGTLAVDDELLALGPSGNKLVRVRGIQTHGNKEKTIGPGNRVAVNLSGASHEELLRGDALIRGGQWHRTTRFDARLDVLAAVEHDVSRRGAFALAIGSGEFPVKVRVLGDTSLAGGTSGFVRIHLPIPLPLLPGDRAILRDYGREETIGGIEVLDVDPRRAAAGNTPDATVERLVSERGWLELEQLGRLSPFTWIGRVVAGKWAVSEPAYQAMCDSIRTRTESAGALGLDPAQLDDRARAVLPDLRDEGISLRDGRVKRGEVRDPLADHPYIAALLASPFQPPDPSGVDKAELRELIRRGLVVSADGVWFAPAALQQAAVLVAPLFVEHPDGITVAQIRDALGTTRKYILPLVGWFDANGITRRRDGLRIPGPKLPMPNSPERS